MSKSPVMRNEQATRLDIKDRLAKRVNLAFEKKLRKPSAIPGSVTVTFRTSGGRDGS